MIYTNTTFFSGNNPKFFTIERPQIPPALHTRLLVACQHCVKLKNKMYNMMRVWVNHQEEVEWWERPFLVPTQVQMQAWRFDILRKSIICLRSSRQISYITSNDATTAQFIYLFIHSFIRVFMYSVIHLFMASLKHRQQLRLLFIYDLFNTQYQLTLRLYLTC